jgi:2-iminobutanoate/2-iminopropanoate deaminase
MSSQRIEYVIPPASKQFCESIRYAEGVKVGDMLYCAGQVGWNPATGKVVEGGLREQVHLAFTNLKTLIEHAGGKMDGVVQLMSFLADKGSTAPLIDEFSIVVEVQKQFFTTGLPCGTVVRVKELAFPELLVELQAIVAL